GMDPIHSGVLMARNLARGSNTPPIALSLLTARRILKINVEKTVPHTLYFSGFLMLAIVAIIVFPRLPLFWPDFNRSLGIFHDIHITTVGREETANVILTK